MASNSIPFLSHHSAYLPALSIFLLDSCISLTFWFNESSLCFAFLSRAHVIYLY